MDLLTGVLPEVGQYSLMTLSIAFNLFCLVQIVRGEIVPLSRVSQWQKAWEVTMQTQKETAEMVSDLRVVGETLEHLIESLPKPSTEETAGE